MSKSITILFLLFGLDILIDPCMKDEHLKNYLATLYGMEIQEISSFLTKFCFNQLFHSVKHDSKSQVQSTITSSPEN